MMSKKGISDIIAWVLLIGFTIAMAAFVSNWVIEQTKKFNPEGAVGGPKIYCEDVILNIENIIKRDGDCADEGVNFIGTFTLKNKGKFIIYNVKGLGPGAGKISLPDGKLAPGESKDINFGFLCKESGNEIELIPLIKVEDKEYYCSDSSVTINDEVLSPVLSPN